MDLPTPCADQDTLQAIAERIWQERVRQELSGTLTTREMSMASASGQQQYDLLALSAGDQIQIQIDPAALDAIQKLPSIGQRVQALMNKGYASDIANFIAENLSSITSLPAQFLCHSIETTIDATSLPGSYNVSIHFLNLVSLTGDGSVTAQVPGAPISGAPIPPLDGQSVTGPVPS